MIKLIIFDWDDVITLGSKEGYFRRYHETLAELGVHLDPEEEKKRILSKWSQPHREELRALLAENLDLLDKACGIYEAKLFGDTFVSALHIVDGVRELLERLSSEYKLAIATGMNKQLLVDRIMPTFNIPNRFAQIISAYDIDDVEKHKPHPHMVESILEGQGISSNETVLVGDAKSDVLMAQAAGVIPVVVLTGHLKKDEAEALKVPYIISDVTHLESILAKLNDV